MDIYRDIRKREMEAIKAAERRIKELLADDFIPIIKSNIDNPKRSHVNVRKRRRSRSRSHK